MLDAASIDLYGMNLEHDREFSAVVYRTFINLTLAGNSCKTPLTLVQPTVGISAAPTEVAPLSARTREVGRVCSSHRSWTRSVSQNDSDDYIGVTGNRDKGLLSVINGSGGVARVGLPRVERVHRFMRLHSLSLSHHLDFIHCRFRFMRLHSLSLSLHETFRFMRLHSLSLSHHLDFIHCRFRFMRLHSLSLLLHEISAVVKVTMDHLRPQTQPKRHPPCAVLPPLRRLQTVCCAVHIVQSSGEREIDSFIDRRARYRRSVVCLDDLCRPGDQK
ncbi:hypothetical protein J6590_019815 [Homalodisca vitripennis]|nr:hypothetical protein J6590_019815 [Homalodisca vitripennis]